MRAAQKRVAVAILATTAFVAAAQAQTATCVNDAPNPYHLVNDWAHMPRPWAATNNVYVDAKDDIWVFDRCDDKGCSGLKVGGIHEVRRHQRTATDVRNTT